MYEKEKRLDETFGQYIVRLREQRNWSQRKLALVSDLSNTTISRIESSDGTDRPEPSTIKKLSKAFDIDELYMMKAAGYVDSEIYGDEIKPSNIKLTMKEEKDVEKILNETMRMIEDAEGLMLNGEILDENDKLALRQAIELGIRYAKENNKKYTPKKYRKE